MGTHNKTVRVNSVFVLDSDSSARKGIARLVRTANYDVRDFASANEFIDALGSELPGCVVLDAGAPGLSGEELQVELQARGLHPPIIVVTAFDDSETRRKAQKLNAVSFFRKPVDGTALLDTDVARLKQGKNCQAGSPRSTISHVKPTPPLQRLR